MLFEPIHRGPVAAGEVRLVGIEVPIVSIGINARS